MALRKLYLMAALALGAAACDPGRVPGPERDPIQGFWARAAEDTTAATDSVEQALPHQKRNDF